MEETITALKNLDWNIFVNDKEEDVFVTFNRATKFRFPRGRWGRLTGELNDSNLLKQIVAQLTQLLLYFIH